MGKPKRKAQGKLETVKTLVEIFAGLASIVLAVYEILKG